MKVEGVQHIDAPRAKVYQLLVDPVGLSRFIPGCEQLERTGDNTFAATLKAGVGSIKGTFKSTVKLEDLRPNEHFRMVVDGKGAPGFVKGSGDLDLSDEDVGTSVKYSGDIQVGGTIASVGQRMIQATAKMMAVQFFTSLERDAKPSGDTSSAPPPNFFRRALSWISGWLREFFRKR
ncbi:MAG: carbon monoxide dehydrogenase [Blastocatellia bacterium]|nr:MAG: carbon monoxide dehydrogenase [Blastocatellia bacterium]